MPKRPTAFFLILALLTSATSALSQSQDERQAWKAQIEEAKARAAQKRLEAVETLRRHKAERSSDSLMTLQEVIAKRNSEAVLSDQSLQRGDIVSTIEGLFVYTGTGSNPSAKDFVPLQGAQTRRPKDAP